MHCTVSTNQSHALYCVNQSESCIVMSIDQWESSIDLVKYHPLWKVDCWMPFFTGWTNLNKSPLFTISWLQDCCCWWTQCSQPLRVNVNQQIDNLILLLTIYYMKFRFRYWKVTLHLYLFGPRSPHCCFCPKVRKCIEVTTQIHSSAASCIRGRDLNIQQVSKTWGLRLLKIL